MKLTQLLIPALAGVMLLNCATSCNESEQPELDDPTKPNTPSTPNVPNYSPVNEEKISKALVCGKVLPKNNSNYQQAKEYRAKAKGFYWKLADAVGCNSTDNIAVSPISAFMVLGMAAESANGDTQKEILEALGLTYEELETLAPILNNDMNRILSESVDEFGGKLENSENMPKNIVKSVNSIWACDRIHYNDQGLAKISTDFYSDIFRTDFKSGEGNKLMNSYIKNETRGFLDINLDVPPSTVMALMNVLYIKEIWNQSGNDLIETKDEYEFSNTDKTIRKGKLLNGYYHSGRALVAEKFRKFYTVTNSGYKLTFLVPNDGYSASDIYNVECLGLNTPYTYSEDNKIFHTRCFFPEFKTEFFESIKGSVQKLGIKQFFTDGGCDFSSLVASIDNAPGVYCSDVKQAAKFEVQKSGIEGAAVTVATMEAATSPGPDAKVYEDVYEDFIVDRAFAYTFEDPYGNVIFTGVVNKIEERGKRKVESGKCKV